MSITLCTTDNCEKSLTELFGEKNPPAENDTAAQRFAFRALSEAANIPLAELEKQNTSLVVFPSELGRHGDEIEKQKIFELSGTQNALEKVRLTTGNVAGFIGIKTAGAEVQLEITSRFAPNAGEDFFLHYLLEKVFALNLFDWQNSSKTGQFDFLLYLFPHFLKKALAQGMFKEYRFERKNDANVKGALDASRHIRENIPFRGKISYNTRERSPDNPMTQLVRHTIESIRTRANGKAVLSADEETRNAVSQIVAATPSYSVQARRKIISQNAKPVRHPYFSDYAPLQKICRAILCHHKLKFGDNSRKIYGVLFDVAWLWEEYLAVVLKDSGFIHAENKTGKNPIALWNGNPRYPDFYKGKQNHDFTYGDEIPERNVVLDAKYKPLDKHSISREDAHQMVTYMHILPAKRAVLIYPHKPDDEGFSKMQKEYSVRGLGGIVHVVGMKIPQNSSTQKEFAKEMSAAEFHSKMEKAEEAFLKEIAAETAL